MSVQSGKSAVTEDNYKPIRLRCEYADAPLGVDAPQPKLSWETGCDRPGFIQSAYRILVASSPANIDHDIGDLWDSQITVSNAQTAVRYKGAPLASKSRYWWKIKVWDRAGKESSWSNNAVFETGMFHAGDWNCRWFNCEYPNSPTAVYYERREFVTRTSAPVLAARVYIGATGSKANAYELRINGAKAGEDLISPGQTHFKRGIYRTYDVTDLLRSGPNAIGIMHTRKVIFHLDIRYTDGTSEIIVSDAAWKRLHKGPYVSLRYAGGSISEGKGETFDARLAPDGWDLPGYDDSLWGRPIPDTGPLVLTSQLQSIKAAGELLPISIVKKGKSGRADSPQESAYIVDFGQNLFGTVCLTVKGEAGTKVILRYAECLSEDGSLDPGSIEAGWLAHPQAQYDEYILKGSGEESYQPRFSCHGFRYVEVSGYPGVLDTGRITAKVIHNDILNGSQFHCSNGLLNQLQHNAVWSFRSNLVSVPLDCPSRERQGWLGDAHCHSEADCFNFDMAAFYEKWFDDIADSQLENGIVPLICPSEGHEYALDMPWASAVIMIPWDYYMAYGDKAFLLKHYDLMKRCLGAFRNHLDSHYLLQNSLIFGDWFGSVSDISGVYLATAYYYRCLTLLSRISEELGLLDDMALYSGLALRVRDGINTAFLKEGRYYDTNSQTANALALYLEVVPEASKEVVADSLAEDIASRGTMTAGCLGAEAIMEALAGNGRNDAAYGLAVNTTKGCWGYWIKEYGATTAFESFADNRSSNNHAFLVGGLSAWFYKHLAGISPIRPGYASIRIKPYFPEDLDSASAQVGTVRGWVKSSWYREAAGIVLKVTIPPNAEAEVYVPSVDQEGRVLPAGSYTVYSVGSGSYSFRTEAGKEPL